MAQKPSAAAPLVVPVERWSGEQVEQALAAVYQPHQAAPLAASVGTIVRACVLQTLKNPCA